jgi:hypothetical protein
VGPPAHPQQHRFDVVPRRTPAGLDGSLHFVDGMLLQQLQDAGIVLDAAAGPVLFFQRRAQFAENGRQVPAPEDVGMVQRRRPPLQRLQVMLRIEDLLVFPVRPRVRSDHLAAQHQIDPVDVRLDRHRLEGRRPRHAVAVVVETDCLVLVSSRRLQDAGIEARFDQGQGCGRIAGEPLADRLGLAGLDTVTLALTAGAQVNIQGGQVCHPGHRCGPITLQMAHPAFDAGLFLRPTHQAKAGLEGIMAD